MMLFLAVATTITQQSLAYMSQLVVAIAAPELSKVLGVPVALAGFHLGMLYAGSMCFMLFAGGFIRKYGAVRMSQLSLVGMGLGLLLGVFGEVWALALGAIVIGTSSAFSTPASSDILARYAPPKHAALIFSIKQTGVPAGGIIAGIVVPFLLVNFGWQGIFIGTAAMNIGLAAILQVLRGVFDKNRSPNFRISVRQAYYTLKGVLVPAPFRRLVMATFAYCGLQGVYGAFFVSFLVKGLDMTLVEAGGVFALSQVAAVVARIFWGWMVGLAGRAAPVLAVLGISMAGFAALCLAMDKGWPSVAVTALAMAYSATAISWHGVILAEIAARSRREDVATNTGGVLAFAVGGQFVYPALMGWLLGAGGSFGLGYALAGVPALLVGIMYVHRSMLPATPSAPPPEQGTAP